MMRYVAFFFCVFVVLSSLAPAGRAQVMLNEIVADPASDWDGDGTLDSKRDEWVEIMNVGTSAVDLTAYRLSDAGAGTNFRFAFEGTLDAGAVRVVYGSEVVAWQSAHGVGAYGLSLNNGGDTVTLYRIAGSDTTEADAYQYASAQVANDRSVGRLPNGTGVWVLFDAMNPYTGSDYVATGCSPSPGAATQCATPVETSSWGRVKSMYVQ